MLKRLNAPISFRTGPLLLDEFSQRFCTWVEDARLETKTKRYYRNGWRLLNLTSVAGLRDTGMRNQQELYRMRIDNLDWENRLIFVPIDRPFRQARAKAGLPKDLVLYCARHDYGTRILMRTGNLAAVMKTMGHRDVKTAMHYQHPELEIVRAALDYNANAAMVK